MKRITALASIAFSLLSTASGTAQVTLDALSATPPSPTTAESVIANIGGMVNRLELPNFRTEWKRAGTEILVDVLQDFIPAPPVFPSIEMIPYAEDVTLGNLPAGTYDLTARLFSLHRQLPGESPFPDPWTIPETHDGFVESLATTFTVVPEPSSLALAVAGALLLVRRNRDR